MKHMIAKQKDWYRDGWTLDIKQQSWTENTEEQVDFIIKNLELKGDERILDLACGYGRHSLSFARRGYEVVGVDITKAYVEDARAEAGKAGLQAQFICSDIRQTHFENEFDVVLNLADGAIGYLENDAENLRIFDIIAAALKKGGKSFIDIQSGDYADAHFPQKLWDAGSETLTLSNFEWDRKTRIMLYGQVDFPYGEILQKPDMQYGNPTRLYTCDEIKKMMQERGMEVVAAYQDYEGREAGTDGIQLMVSSIRKK